MTDQQQVKPHLSTLLLVLSLTACSYNPLSESNHTTGSPYGVAIGGAAGLGAAAALGAKSAPALTAATLGGAGIGYYVTSLRFASSGVVHAGGQVYTLGDYVTIEIPSDRLFIPNTAELTFDAEPILLSASDVLQRYCCQNILVSGNTSGFSNARFERKLSGERARVVSNYLWAHGVNNFQKISNDTRKLTYVGYGNYFPIANEIKNQGIRANSRIQITMYPTRDQLLIEKKKQVFNNMGGYDESHLAPMAPSIQAENAFPAGDVLPESNVNRTSDIKGVFAETPGNPVISPNNPRQTDYYSERANQNTIEKAFPLTENKREPRQVEFSKGEG